jgi:hypothetical protein
VSIIELPETKDEIIDEIRESKYRLSKKFDNDVSKIAEYLKEQEALSGENLISEIPKGKQH